MSPAASRPAFNLKEKQNNENSASCPTDDYPTITFCFFMELLLWPSLCGLCLDL